MIEQILIENFNKTTCGKDSVGGKRIVSNDLISDINLNIDDDLLYIDTKIISEDLFNEYKSNVELDIQDKSVISTSCTCLDFQKNELTKSNYCCKHLYASFYKFLDELDDNLHIKSKLDTNSKNIFKSNKSSILNILLEKEDLDEIKLEVYINKVGLKNKIVAQFKIGLKGLSSNKLYTLKDIDALLIAYYNKISIKYGKDFTLNFKKQSFGLKEREIINFIEKVKEIDLSLGALRRRDKLIDGKNLTIPKFLLRDFFSVISKNRVYLNDGFFQRAVEAEIIQDKIDIKFSLKSYAKEYLLSIEDSLPEILDDKGFVFLSGTSIYIPKSEYCIDIEPYFKIFNSTNSISMSKKEEVKILSRLLPKLYTLSEYVNTDRAIQNKIVKEKVEFKFYFDKVGKDIVLVLKVRYGKCEFNIFHEYKEKIVYRDLKSENEVLSILRSLGFESSNDKFYLLLGDDYLFKFFKHDIQRLNSVGEVFYSKNFKLIKPIGSKNISANIRCGKYDYFEFDFKIADLNEEEVKGIILALRDNLKYFKLRDGEFIDLEELELKNFLNLLDNLSSKNIENYGKIVINKSKALYLDNFIEQNSIKYIRGRGELSSLKKKIKDIKKLTFKEPSSLNTVLRPYQKEGFNWLKTMDYLGFGGILADEMGLGKTIQSISFISSSLPSKTLIVAPASLIYNWGNEIEKFSNNLKYIIVNGTKEDRITQLNDISSVDIIITTYNLLKKDLDEYKKLEFDYFFIDEAQYIKNPSSLNASAVKSINAKTRFAITGTPVENSLMELWSIFDFCMPGYLFDEKDFAVRYHKRLEESDEVLNELNMLTKPFILRRYKKEVAKELPSKIDKRLLVPMSIKQQEVYSAYAKYAKDLIEKKVKDDDLKNSKIEILSYITKLRQLCLDPSVLIDDYIGDSGKIESLIEILNQVIDGGHKVLVFSQFTSVLKNIKNRLDFENISNSYLDGSIPSDKRLNIVDDFNNGSNSVFLISLKSGGTGLNLTSADIVIHFDPWWNPSVEDQATDRAHRIGQENVVEVIKLIAKDTIEEKIVKLQDEKRNLIEKIIDNKEDLKTINNLSEEDILNLFSL